MEYQFHNNGHTKWEHIQVRVTPELKEKIKKYCTGDRPDMSTITRLFWIKLLVNAQEMPEVMKDAGVTKEIDIATNEIVGYLPIVAKQKQFNRNRY